MRNYYNPGHSTVEDFINLVGFCKVVEWVEQCRTCVDFYQLSRRKSTFVYHAGGKHITLKPVLDYLNIDYD